MESHEKVHLEKSYEMIHIKINVHYLDTTSIKKGFGELKRKHDTYIFKIDLESRPRKPYILII